MYRLWTFLASFFNELAQKSRRGKAILTDGRSARQRAFLYFMEGLRPSQLPPLGVPKSTIYRYHQAFKHRWQDLQFRLTRRKLMADQGLRKNFAELFGVSEEALTEALKGCRSKAQLCKRLRLDDAKQIDEMTERVEEIDHARLVNRLRECKTLQEREVVLREEARKWNVSEGQFLFMLRDRIKRFGK